MLNLFCRELGKTENIGCLAYADDIILLTKNYEKLLKRLSDKLIEASKRIL